MGLGLALLLAACGSEPSASSVDAPPAEVCAPECGDRQCGPDGCGGECGTCDEGAACGSDGRCVGAGAAEETPASPASDPEPDCSETCESLEWTCGTHCDEDCGRCEGANDSCVEGACVCRSSCDGRSCMEPDGCGGTCGPCPRVVSCTDCALNLKLVRRDETEGVLRSVVLAVDYEPVAGTPMPAIVDLRLRLDGPVQVERVGLGAAALGAHKELVIDPRSGRPYQLRSDEDGQVLQIMVMSPGTVERIPAGRWVFVHLRVGEETGLRTGAVTASLMRTGEIFAPPLADATLGWPAGMEEPIVVRPRGIHGP